MHQLKTSEVSSDPFVSVVTSIIRLIASEITLKNFQSLDMPSPSPQLSPSPNLGERVQAGVG